MHSITHFQKLLLQIPKGKVTTYAELAKAMDCPKGARAIGNLLNKNPDPNTYPCYKVVKSTGELGGFALGSADKIRRLTADNICIQKNRVQNFEEVLFRF